MLLSTKNTEVEYLGLVAFRVSGDPMPLMTAPPSRPWMDATDEEYAKRCLPMLIANQAGWLVLNTNSVRATWGGGASIDSLRVEHLGGKPPFSVLSHFGHGILTWNLPYLFQTPPGYNLLVRGPSNWPKDGAYPLEGLVETDWAASTFTMNWVLTRPEYPVTFEAHEPVCMILPQRRGELEKFDPKILSIDSEPDLKARYTEWSKSRAQFLSLLATPNSSARQEGWQKHYFHGVCADRGRIAEHQTKLKLRAFQRPGEARCVTEILKRPRFVSKAKCATLIEAFGRLAGSNGTTRIRRTPNRIELSGLAFGEMGFDDVCDSLADIRTRAIQAIEELYKPRYRLYIEFTLLSEMHPGDAHTLHSDSEAQDSTGKWGPNHTPWREFTMMLYLNTSGVDYGGGVLRFPELDQQLIPKAGLLVGFPCGRTHQHEVTPIETGLRYSVSIWTTADRARAERWR